MKKELQKRKGIFLAFLGFLCAVSIQAQTWTAPIPEGSVLADSTQYYVYSVGAKAFLDRGGEWDAQAIVTQPVGALMNTIKDGLLWNLRYENNSAKCLKIDGGGWTYTDGAATHVWDVQVTDAVNNVYSIQVPSTNGNYVVDQFLGTSSTLYSSNNEGTVYDVRYNRTASDHTKWMFVTAEAVAKYNAKVQLDKYMSIAKLVGSSVDLTSYVSTYNTGATADITTAVTNLKAALTVVDKTSSIANPSFDTNNTTGWTTPTAGTSNNNLVEFWHKNPFSIYQTVTGLPAGVYVVKAQGFQRPVGLNTAQRTNYTNGSDVLSAKFYATVSDVTTFIPLKSIYSETTCTAGTTVDALKFSNSTGDARSAFDLGLYENELGYFIVDGTGSITIGVSGVYKGSTGDWHVLDNFRLEYYGAVTTPMLSTSTSSISFSGTTSSSFTVTSNQAGDVTLTAPAGITLSTYTIPANPSPVSVDVTYDGTTTVADTIRLSCGALVAKIAVKANPTLTTSTSFIAFEGTTSSLFTVSSSQASAVTLTAPAGITLSTYSIPANPSAVSVDVTYDGTTSVDDTIRLACGALVAKIAVKSYSAACFTPLYSTGLLITDPQCSSYLTDGWGTKSINTNPAYVYCGSSSGYINNGSIDRRLNGTNGNAQMLPNTTYRVKAMVYQVSGALQIGVWGWDNASGDINHPVTSTGAWETVDFTFTTAATLKANQGIFFNNGVGYIDNWEMYDVTLITALNTSNELSKSSVYMKGNAIVADFDLAQSSNVEISVFNAQGMLLNKTIGSFNAGKNSKVVDVNLVSGLYLVKLTQNGKSITTKVIK